MGILSFFSIHRHMFEEVQTDVEVKDCANSDWTEEANENRLPCLLNLRNQTVYGEDERKTTEHQNENSKEDQPIDWDVIVM